jgi:hypothetical protein
LHAGAERGVRRVIEMIHALAASARDPKWGFSGPYMAAATPMPGRRRSSGTDLDAADAPADPSDVGRLLCAPLVYSPPPSVKPACAKGGRRSSEA